jgi:hypothetical protein
MSRKKYQVCSPLEREVREEREESEEYEKHDRKKDSSVQLNNRMCIPTDPVFIYSDYQNNKILPKTVQINMICTGGIL